MVRVISLVRQQGAKRQALDQLFRAGDFASLPRHQRKPRKVAQSVDKREDFRWSCRPGFFRSPDFEFPFSALSMAMDLADRAIDHSKLKVGIIR